MAKIRGIKPEFWTDETVVSLKIPTRLFFLGLWNFCDDQGVFEWKPLELKMKIFPADNFDVEKTLRELVVSTCVKKFTHENKDYGIVVNFTKHQKPDKRYFKTLIEPLQLANILKLVVGTTRPPRDHHADSEGEGEGESEGEVSSKEDKATPRKENKEITEMLMALKGTIGIDAFADSRIERNIGIHIVNLYQKIGREEFKRRLDYVLGDSFRRKNCNRIKYLYGELKSVPKNIKPHCLTIEE